MPFIPPDPPVTVQRHGDDLWVLTQPLTYQGNTDRWVIPAGFVTDFASVPRVGVWLIPRFGPSASPSSRCR